MVTEFEVVKKDDWEGFNGGSLKGYVKAEFRDLCLAFGPPTYGPFDMSGDKVTCEWKIRTSDGLTLTIYDWKMGDTPLDEYNWHVGGQDFKAVDWLQEQGLNAWRYV